MAELLTTEQQDHYRVAMDEPGALGHCEHCGHGAMWTIVFSLSNGEECGIGSSYADKELAEDICDHMNTAFDAGRESVTALPKLSDERVTELRQQAGRLLSALNVYEIEALRELLKTGLSELTEPGDEAVAKDVTSSDSVESATRKRGPVTGASLTSKLRTEAIQQVIAKATAWMYADGRLTDETWHLMGDLRRELQFVLDDSGGETSAVRELNGGGYLWHIPHCPACPHDGGSPSPSKTSCSGDAP